MANNDTEAKIFAFGFSATSVAAVLAILAVDKPSNALSWAIFFFGISFPSGIASGILYHFRSKEPDGTALNGVRRCILVGADLIAILASFAGVASIFLAKSFSAFLAVIFGTAIWIVLLAIYRPGKK